MEMCKIEYMRKNGGVATKLEDGTYVRHNKGEKRGVLFCGIHPNNNDDVVVGFSLCNKLDEFDVINGERRKGFGLRIAKKRALKWSDHTEYFIQTSWTEEEIEDLSISLEYINNPNIEEIVEVPPSVAKKLLNFLERCMRYYQDKNFPEWANKFMNHNEYQLCSLDFVEVRPALDIEEIEE
jgi:hypothetical protein